MSNHHPNLQKRKDGDIHPKDKSRIHHLIIFTNSVTNTLNMIISLPQLEFQGMHIDATNSSDLIFLGIFKVLSRTLNYFSYEDRADYKHKKEPHEKLLKYFEHVVIVHGLYRKDYRIFSYFSLLCPIFKYNKVRIIVLIF